MPDRDDLQATRDPEARSGICQRGDSGTFIKLAQHLLSVNHSETWLWLSWKPALLSFVILSTIDPAY